MIEIVQQLGIDTQLELITEIRKLVKEAPLFQKTMPNGAAFHYLCTSAGDYGWLSDRKGYRYATEHPLTRNRFPPIPDSIASIAIEAAQQVGLVLRPETALINWYNAEGKLGLHQDKTEQSDAPVISISLGDDCAFIVGGLERSSPKESLRLVSGTVLIMGAEHRYIYHGVRRIYPGTGPVALDFKQPGRVNITVRQVNPCIADDADL